jgi:hypothetical protein
MSTAETRAMLEDGSPFNEREWLRREVLWGSLMVPYRDQMNLFMNGGENAHYQDNASRVDIYAEDTNDQDLQAMAFLNAGKQLAGLLSGAALFRTSMFEQPREDGEPITERALTAQARSIDIALGLRNISSIIPETEKEAFLSSKRLATAAMFSESQSHAQRHFCLRAAKIMTGFAVQVAPTWQAYTQQDAEHSLPTLVVANGGTPRSVGPRKDALQPIFHEILASAEYQAVGALH